MLNKIDNGSPRALTLALAVIILTLVISLSGPTMDSLGPMFKDWQFPTLNPPPNLPMTNGTDRVLFSVAPTQNPRYWRMDAYDGYSGSSWTKTSDKVNNYQIGTDIDTKVSTYQDKTTYNYTITISGQATGYLPIALNTVKIFNGSSSSKYGLSDYSSLYAYGELHSYSFSVVQYNYTQDMLSNANVVGKDTAPNYYDLPLSIPARVKNLALNITSGAKSSYEKALLLSSYLKSNAFKYTNNIVQPANTDLTDWFLFGSKKGNCIEFATAFVVLARYNDLPTRYVTGYALGQMEKGVRVVKNSHAHAWAEIWFDKLGWIAFEVTGSNYDNSGESGAIVDGVDNAIIGGGTGGGTAGSHLGKPDLVFINGMSFSSEKIIRNKKYNILSTVKNIGNGTSDITTVRFYEISNTLNNSFGEAYIPSLSIDAEYSIWLPWKPLYSGTNEIFGIIDPGNLIDESDKSNNNISAYINVLSGIDIVVDPSYVQFIQKSVIVNRNLTLEVTLRNDGDIPVLQNGIILIYDNGIEVGWSTNVTINSFGTTTLAFTWFANTSGNHKIVINTKPVEGVNDLNWTNNNLTLYLTVKNPLDIVMVVWNDKNGDMLFGKGDVVTVSVKNYVNQSTSFAVSLIYRSQNITNTSYITSNQTKTLDININFDYIEDTTDVRLVTYPLYALDKADLAFSSNITFQADTKVPGNYLIHASIKNIGKKSSYATTVQFTEKSNMSQGYDIGIDDIPGLKPGEITNITMGWKPVLIGRVEVDAIIDPNDLVDESNKTNNVCSEFINISFFYSTEGLKSLSGQSLQLAIKGFAYQTGDNIKNFVNIKDNNNPKLISVLFIPKTLINTDHSSKNKSERGYYDRHCI